MPCTPSSLLLSVVLVVTGGALVRAGDGGPLTVLGVVLAVVGVLVAVLDAVIADPQAALAKLRAKQAALLAGSPAVADPGAETCPQERAEDAPTAAARNRAERRAAARRH